MKKVVQDNHRIEVHPDTSVSRGFYRQHLRPDDPAYGKVMQERCEEIKGQILRHTDGLSLSSDNRISPGAVQVLWDVEEVCSFCGAQWEELTADLIEEHPDFIEQDGDGPGLPLCCEEAQEEWREANVRTCTHQIAGGYYFAPEYCDEVAEEVSDYCATHKAAVEALEVLVEKTTASE